MAVLISSVTPLRVTTANHAAGMPSAAVYGVRESHAANGPDFYVDVAPGADYRCNCPGEKLTLRSAARWWRQGMMGSALAHYEGIKAFSETDQTDDVKAITVPTLLLHGDDDQVVPYKDASVVQAKLLKNGTLKIYPGCPHGMITTHADVINTEILAFINETAVKAA